MALLSSGGDTLSKKKKLKNLDEATFYVPGEVKGKSTPISSKRTRRFRIRSRFRSTDAHDEQKRMNLRRIMGQ